MTLPVAQKTIGIIGSAIAGPTLALQILSHPILREAYKPILFDRAKDPKILSEADRLQTGGAAVGLFANGIYPLHQLGLQDALEEISIETPVASFWSATGQSFNNGEIKYIGTTVDMGWTEDIPKSATIVERSALQLLLIGEVQRKGGQVIWDCNLQQLERPDKNRIRAVSNERNYDLDLLVGADGAFSRVRRHLLNEVNPKTAEKRWMPDHCGMTGIYSVSSNIQNLKKEARPGAYDETHAVWLDSGFLSTSPLPNDKMRWDLLFSEPKEIPKEAKSQRDEQALSKTAEWESSIVTNHYPKAYTASLLRKMLPMPNPVTGDFLSLLSSSDCIVHTPLRQKVWEANEIQHDNIVLIGDAARLMLPTSGQGTSFAIEDATVLANALLNNPPDEQGDFDAALKEYARIRVPRSKKMAQIALYAGKMGLGHSWLWWFVRSATAWFLPSAETAAKSKPKNAAPWLMSERCKIELRS